jgi:RHS repeat-associated protein
VANGVANKLPHALSLVSLSGNTGSRFYNYDANGNRTSELWQQGTTVNNTRSYSYTSFNMVATLSATANGTTGTTVSETYSYGPEHQRVKQVSTTLGTIYYLNPGNSGDLFFEKEIKPDNSVELRSYVSAGGGVIAEIKQMTSAANVSSEQTRYFQRDALGSTSVVTGETGVVLERLAYEPFGKRRQAAGPQDPGNTIADPIGQRGFTNHEHMDELGLINMNGRVYDPMTARFISADPMVQAPMNSQSYNRYSYLWNSPLNGTDPSGYCGGVLGSVGICLDDAGNSVADLFHHWINVVHNDPNANMVATIAAAWFAQDYVGVGTLGGAAAGGFAGGMVSSGGDLNSGAKGAAIAMMFYGVGEKWSYESHQAANISGHAAVGCLSATMSGGDCGTGAVSAGIADYATGSMPGPLKGANNLALNTAYIAIVGGTTSVIAGGKFVNGAETAAFGYLFNQQAHDNLSYTGFAKGQYPSWWDPIVDRAVGTYNQSNGYSLGDPAYLDPALIKAQIRVESGTNMSAYMNDPMQVNVAGDWVPEKSNIGLTKGVAPGPVLGINAGIDWLSYKGFIHDATGAAVTFRGWDAAVTRYNGGGDPNYLSKVKDQLQK